MHAQHPSPVLQFPRGKLIIDEQSIGSYLDALASKDATPGGGAAAGISGAQACALIAMVCRLTREHEDEIARVTASSDRARARFLDLARQDMETFEAVMSAYRLPKKGREQALQDALKRAADVPLAMIAEAIALVDDISLLSRIGNPNLITDVGIAALLIQATVRSARLNVLVNTRAVHDAAFVDSATRRLADAVSRIAALDATIAAIDESLGRGAQERPAP